MTSLYIDQSNLDLKEDNRTIRIYKNGDLQQRIPLRLIDRVVVQGNVRLSSKLIGDIAESGASLLFLSRRRSERVATIIGKPHNDARIRLAQYAQVNDSNKSLIWARRVVREKIRSQRKLLNAALQQRPDLRLALQSAIQKLRQAGQRVGAIDIEQGDSTLLGLEGSAARAYFHAYTKLFPASVNFSGRNRRPPRDPVNAALSLSYTLLHHEAVTAAWSAGLDPYLGFYHKPTWSRESLACDLVEVLRAEVDAWVWERFRKRDFRIEQFTVDKGACLFGKAGRAVFYAEWEAFAATLRSKLRLLTRSVINRLLINEEVEKEEADYVS